MLEKLELVGILYLVERWSGTIPHSWGGQELSARATRKGSANLSDLTATPWHSGLDHVARWEDVLSLGEQQRLSLARMFWCAPLELSPSRFRLQTLLFFLFRLGGRPPLPQPCV